MKKETTIGSYLLKVLLMLAVCICISAAASVSAETYDTISLEGLSESNRFFAKMNGAQYKDAYYFFEADSLLQKGTIWVYRPGTNGKKETLKKLKTKVYDFMICEGRIVYINSKREIHFYDIDTKKDKKLRNDGYYLYAYNGDVVCYCDYGSWENCFVNMEGKKAEDYTVKLPEEPSVEFEKPSEVRYYDTIYVDGVFYIGATLKDGKYRLYRLVDDNYEIIVDSTDVITSTCYKINGVPCFMNKDLNGQVVLYQLRDNELVEVGSYPRKQLYGRGSSEYHTEGGYLRILVKGEYDFCYIFDEYFNLVYQGQFAENYYNWTVRDGILYESYAKRKPVNRYKVIDLHAKSAEMNNIRKEQAYLAASYLGGGDPYDEGNYDAIAPYVGKWYNGEECYNGIAGFYVYSDGFYSVVETNGAVSPIVSSCYVNKQGKLVLNGAYTVKNKKLVGSNGIEYSKVNDNFSDSWVPEEFMGEWRYWDDSEEDSYLRILPDNTFTFCTSSDCVSGSVEVTSPSTAKLVNSETGKTVLYVWMTTGNSLEAGKKKNRTKTTELYYYGEAFDDKAG